MIAKLKWAQSNAQQNIEQLQNHYGFNNQQRTNNNRMIALERQQPTPLGGGGGGGVNAFYWYQIFALDSAVVEAQAC